MNLEKVFNRKQVKEEAGKTPLTVGEMQGMFHDYGIRVFNTETNELEIATMHNATTADLLSVIKYYEDNLVKVFTSTEPKFKANKEWFKDYVTTWCKIHYSKAINDIIENDQKQFDEQLTQAYQLGKRQNNIAGIVWEKRYSTTEADDKFGRWMRIGRINDMTIAIIIKAVHLEKIKYVVKLPNNKGDESLQSDIMANSENEAMLAAEKHIAEYVANFYKIIIA